MEEVSWSESSDDIDVDQLCEDLIKTSGLGSEKSSLNDRQKSVVVASDDESDVKTDLEEQSSSATSNAEANIFSSLKEAIVVLVKLSESDVARHLSKQTKNNHGKKVENKSSPSKSRQNFLPYQKRMWQNQKQFCRL